MIKNFIEIIKHDDYLKKNYDNIINSNDCDVEMVCQIENFFIDYINYYKMNAADIIERYNNFLNRYKFDLINFISSGEYPYEIKDNNYSIDRKTYDIALMISTINNQHRYKIMDLLKRSSEVISGRVLIVGLGSGLEIDFFDDKNIILDAYDMNVSDFIFQKYQNRHNIIQDEFRGTNNKYDAIFAVELLEHLYEPYTFIKLCKKSLNENGLLFTTTATNLPQFDHVFNFKDDKYFLDQIKKSKFSIIKKFEIPHDIRSDRIDIRNTWYTLKKK